MRLNFSRARGAAGRAHTPRSPSRTLHESEHQRQTQPQVCNLAINGIHAAADATFFFSTHAALMASPGLARAAAGATRTRVPPAWRRATQAAAPAPATRPRARSDRDATCCADSHAQAKGAQQHWAAGQVARMQVTDGGSGRWTGEGPRTRSARKNRPQSGCPAGSCVLRLRFASLRFPSLLFGCCCAAADDLRWTRRVSNPGRERNSPEP